MGFANGRKVLKGSCCPTGRFLKGFTVVDWMLVWT